MYMLELEYLSLSVLKLRLEFRPLGLLGLQNVTDFVTSQTLKLCELVPHNKPYACVCVYMYRENIHILITSKLFVYIHV